MSNKPDTEFDEFALNYDEALNKGLSFSGEAKEYFAEKRIAWLKQKLTASGRGWTSILDFGCGTGGSIPYLREAFEPGQIVGVDVSEASIDVAREQFGTASIEFSTVKDLPPSASHDLAFCNGVFHHIPPTERLGCMKYVFDSLKPGGAFAIWENNPWNPGTRFIMSRVPFDRDAITLSFLETRDLLGKAGFKPEAADFLFYFPKCLSALRPFEPMLSRLPFGGQYLVLGIKPG